jgi:hypothetical protein
MLCPVHMLGYLLATRLALAPPAFAVSSPREASKRAAGRILGLNPV